MRKAILVSLAMLCLSAVGAAQDWTTVTASKIQDLNGKLLPIGLLCFQATDSSNAAINFQAGGGGQVVKRPKCTAVTAGAIGSFQVPNPAMTSPVGVFYTVKVYSGSAIPPVSAPILMYQLVQWAGATFNLDAYAPTSPVTVPPAGAVSGPFQVNGNLNVTGSITGTYGSPLGNTAPLIVPAGTDFGAAVNSAIAGLAAGVTKLNVLAAGAQTSSTTITVPTGITLEVCQATVTFSVQPMMILQGSGAFEGCGSNVTDTYTIFQLSGTSGGSGLVENGPGSVSGLEVIGTSGSDGSIGFDYTSGAESARLINSSAKNFEIGAQVGGGVAESSYDHFEDLIFQTGQRGLLVTGNASSFTSLNLTTDGASVACYEFDASAAISIHVDCESFGSDAVVFGNDGNQVYNVYIEGGGNVAHFKGGRNNRVIGGGASSITGGSVYDPGVDQITNSISDVQYVQDFPMNWSALTYYIGSAAGPYTWQLSPIQPAYGIVETFNGPVLSWANISAPVSQGYVGPAPLTTGGLSNFGGIASHGSTITNSLTYGNPPSAPALSCASSGTGTTYTFYVVPHDMNNAPGTVSSAATIQCPNVPSAIYPVTVTPAILWGGYVAAGARCYDYLEADTAHSFGSLCQQGAQNYTGTTASYTLQRDATGDETVSGRLTLGQMTGSTQCLQASSTGLVSGTGAACGSGASGAFQGPFRLENCTPDATGNVFFTVAGLTNWRQGHWEWASGITSSTILTCTVTMPHVLPAGTPYIVVGNLSANDAAAGHTMTFKTGDQMISGNTQIGAFTYQSPQVFTTTSTAYSTSTLSFGLASTPVADGQLVVQIVATTTSSMAANVQTGYLALEWR